MGKPAARITDMKAHGGAIAGPGWPANITGNQVYNLKADFNKHYRGSGITVFYGTFPQ